VFTALGSRGIGWSALGAQVLASLISGAPAPLEADLLDAVDPGRFTSRAYRQRAAR
jgi:tRNA 5-methylaminomethyl-2-thiouridine biosynthesis bifunctional protein